MTLTERNITYISKNLELYGLKDQGLKEDILDHICTYIENIEGNDFDKAYQTAIQKFGGYSNINNIQTETNIQLHYKSVKLRNRFSIVISLFNSILITIGVLFKVQHWPYAGQILVLGFVFFIILTLPFYFYSKYRDKLLKYQF